ncbi:MAG TPA: hypothetical protein VF493_10925 [Terriglobales bacterium]
MWIGTKLLAGVVVASVLILLHRAMGTTAVTFAQYDNPTLSPF